MYGSLVLALCILPYNVWMRHLGSALPRTLTHSWLITTYKHRRCTFHYKAVTCFVRRWRYLSVYFDHFVWTAKKVIPLVKVFRLWNIDVESTIQTTLVKNCLITDNLSNQNSFAVCLLINNIPETENGLVSFRHIKPLCRGGRWGHICYIHLEYCRTKDWPTWDI